MASNKPVLHGADHKGKSANPAVKGHGADPSVLNIDSSANVGDPQGVHSYNAGADDVLVSDGAGGSLWQPPTTDGGVGFLSYAVFSATTTLVSGSGWLVNWGAAPDYSAGEGTTWTFDGVSDFIFDVGGPGFYTASEQYLTQNPLTTRYNFSGQSWNPIAALANVNPVSQWQSSSEALNPTEYATPAYYTATQVWHRLTAGGFSGVNGISAQLFNDPGTLYSAKILIVKLSSTY